MHILRLLFYSMATLLLWTYHEGGVWSTGQTPSVVCHIQLLFALHLLFTWTETASLSQPEQVVAIYTGPGYNPVSCFMFFIFWHCAFIEASDMLESIEIPIVFPLSQISVAVTHIVVFWSSLIINVAYSFMSSWLSVT